MYVESEVGVGDADVRSCAGFFAELVNDGVFHLVSHEFRVLELLGEHYGVNGKRFVEVEILCPVYFLYAFIHFVGVECLEV